MKKQVLVFVIVFFIVSTGLTYAQTVTPSSLTAQFSSVVKALFEEVKNALGTVQ